jgi:hypothetical protein
VAQYLGFYNGKTRAVRGIPHELTTRIEAEGGSDGFGDYMMAEASNHPLTLHRFPFNPEIVKIIADEMAAETSIEALLHARVVGTIDEAENLDGVIIETVKGRRALSAGVIVDGTGDGLLAERAGAAIQPSEDGGERQPNALCFRLSNVDAATFRALPRDFKRDKAREGIANGELF